MERPGWYLVAYDVCDPSRLRRAHRRLLAHGFHAQQSVFFVRTTERGLRRVLDELAELMDTGADDLRAYPVTGPREVWSAGKSVTSDAVVAPARGDDTGDGAVTRLGRWLRRNGS